MVSIAQDHMTTIKLHASVRNRLAKHGTKDQTYEDLIVMLLDRFEPKDIPSDWRGFGQ